MAFLHTGSRLGGCTEEEQHFLRHLVKIDQDFAEWEIQWDFV
jgi:hypothetical protein